MKKLLLILTVFIIGTRGFSQDTITTIPTFTDNNSSNAVSFEVVASSAIKITSISNWWNTGTSSTDIWIKQGPINGSSPLSVNSANGWSLHQAGVTVNGANSNGPSSWVSGMNPINIAAGNTVGIVLTGSMGYFTANNAPVTTFAGAFAQLNAGGVSNGFGGVVPSLVNNPRGFVGSIVVELDLIGNCVNSFTNVTTASILSTSAQINWTPGSTNSSFWLEYGLTGFAPGTGTMITGSYPGSQPPVNLIGLAVNSSYDYYIGEICNSGADSMYAASPCQFTTLCGTITAPHIENFDGATLPSCWSQPSSDNGDWILNAGGTPSIGTGPTDDMTGGGNYMFIETSPGLQGNTFELITPTIDLSALAIPQLRFYSHMYGSSVGTLNVDISNDNGATYTNIFTKSGNQGNQWNEELILLNLTGNVSFKITGSRGSSFFGDIAIDHFEVREGPSCPKPTALVASNITPTSADITWTVGGTESNWNFEYGPVGYNQVNGTSVALTTNSYSLTGLTANTTYDVYVQADCGSGDVSTWVGPVSFFNGYCIPSATSTFTYVNNFSTSNGSSNISNLSSGFNSGGYADFTTQAVESFENGTFDFSAGIVGGSAGFSIWIDWNNDLVFNNATEKVFNTTSYGFSFSGTITIPAQTANGDYRMRITTDWYSSNPSQPCGNRSRAEFEDYTLTVVNPTCPKPTFLAPSNLTTTSADINWTVGGTETNWNFEYGPVGYNQVNGTTVAVTSNSYSLTGLTANTSYDVYVQADCGFGTASPDLSAWVGPFTFTTLCDAISSFPWVEDFESSSTTVSCWRVNNNNGDSDAWSLYNSSFYANSGSNSYRMYTDYNGGSNDDYLITPKLTLTGGEQFKFNHRVRSSFEPNDFTVSLSTTGSDASDFTTVILANASYTNTTYQETIIDLSAYTGDVYIAFHVPPGGLDGWYLYLDDVSVEETPCPIYATIETITACDSYTWPVSGQTYVVSGIKTQILQAVNGCDSTVNLDLTINNSSSSTQSTVTACNSYDWNGTTYTSSGIYVDTSVNSIGCFQYDSLDLTINNSTSFTETPVTACGSYDWNGTNYTSSGTYTYTTANSGGCDSTVTLDLTINNSSSFTETVTACDSLQWNGSTYFTSGNQTFTTTNAANCDSVVNLQLTINNSSSSFLATSSCISYIWNGTTYSSSGVYENISVNSSGCTQTDTLDLTITTSSTSLTQSSCDSFSWNGTDYTTSGTYYSTSGSCVDTLFLTVNSSTSSVTDLVSCDSLEWNGLNYLTSGTYTYVTNNSVGCDSTATLNLTINNSETNTTDTLVTACDSYDWNGTTYTSSGTQLFTATNVAGCDSVLKLILTINNSSSSLLANTSCDSYDWNETTYSTSGIYVDTLVNSSGCFQIDTLDLTINNSSSGTDTQTACVSYTWIDGVTYTSSNNTATHTLTNAAGCDSVVNLDLTVNYSNSGTDVITDCDSITWIDGVTYTTNNNTATHTLTNAAGCDSVVTLDLTINYSSSGTDTQTACDSLTWINGVTYATSNNTATHSLTNAAGCDSVVTLNLTIINSSSVTDTQTACGFYTWIDGVTYTSSNNTATHTLTNAAGCDSVVTLDLTINYSNSGTDVQIACDSLTWIDGITYTSSNNTVIHMLTNSAGCDSVVTLDLTINEFNLEFTESSTLFLSPPFVIQFNNNTPNLINYNFSWDFGDSTIEQNNNASLFYEYMYNGLYDVTLIAEDITYGCGFDTLKKQDLIYCAGGPNLSIIKISNNINVFPNPTNENITVSVNNYNGNVHTEVYDLIGNKLQTTNETTISLRDFYKGVYILKVAYGDRVEEVKVIKE